MKILSLVIGVLLLVPIVGVLHAQELSPAERAELEKEYDKLQDEIAQWEKERFRET